MEADLWTLGLVVVWLYCLTNFVEQFLVWLDNKMESEGRTNA